MDLQQGHGLPKECNQDAATQQMIARFGHLDLLDDLIRLRAADEHQVPILAYPKFENDAATYEYFTGRDLDGLICQGVTQLMAQGFKQKEELIVALFTISDMNMVITFLALSRLGYTVMMLSPRLSAAACVSLLEVTGCDTILHGATANILSTLDDILRLKDVSTKPLVSRIPPSTSFHQPDNTVARCADRSVEANKIALILHSSGSTGTPKPLFLSHRALMTHPLRGPGLTSFNSLPWYHLHGLSTALQAMWMRKTAFMWNASLPLTGSSLATALESSQPESVSAVPYVLQLLVEDPRGIEALRTCKLVTYGGAQCPDELGDRLVREGVRFGGAFGLTEAGLVAESISRPVEDNAWNYMRFFDNIRQFVSMKPIADDLYECVYLPGHPALTVTNSDDPPGSFHSKDIFTPHPTLPDRWKYVTRLDDRITLLNGEKVLPLPIEGCIKQHRLIREAVVVGINRAAPGLLIFRSESSKDLSDTDFINAVWPVIQEANSRSEQFSQISRDMVALLPHATECPLTDKGSLIRTKVYSQFSDIIESIYMKLYSDVDGSLELDVPATKLHLVKLCQRELGIDIPNTEAALFELGVDSLKALHLRRLILRDFKLESMQFGQNIVFEAGNISRLAERIHSLQTGEMLPVKDGCLSMTRLIENYSTFQKHIYCPTNLRKENGVILTGATGSLGAHILSRLLQDENISVVYCLTRRESALDAVLGSLGKRGLGIPSQSHMHKIVALRSVLSEVDFGLDAETLLEMRDSVSLIIHTAWPVNFNLPLISFEPHIQGLHNLIQFSLSVNLPAPAVTFFCSSISAALGVSSTTVREEPLTDLASALDMGYGQSKLVGEHIISNASRAGGRTFSLRIGQISGDSENGIWNDSEAVPLMIRSALTLTALPDLDSKCSWLPVDILASTILDLARFHSAWPSLGSRRDSGYSTDDESSSAVDDTVYNLCDPHSFDWCSLLDELRLSGFKFDTVPFDTWLTMLQKSEMRGEGLINPAVKLVSHYEAMYGRSAESSPGNQKHARMRSKGFITTKAERDSMTFRHHRPKIIQDGILRRYLDFWLQHW